MSLIRTSPRSRRRHRHGKARYWTSGIPDGGFHMRIFLIRLLRWSFRMASVLLVLALLGLLGWGGKAVFDRAFYNNSDYRLQAIQLNPNEAINERDLIAITGLDPDANLFRIDIAEITRRLLEHPAIGDARVERQTPGTLIVNVTARNPRAWLAGAVDPSLPVRRPQALLVAEDDVVYPCPPLQFERARELPVIELAPSEEHPVTVGQALRHPELEACSRLIKLASDHGGQGIAWIESVKQANAWSLALTSRDGTVATFGLSDQERQLNYLYAAFDHAQRKGYKLDTINLIPRENVPFMVSAPRAIVIDDDEPAAPPSRSGPRSAPPPVHRN
jgi:hypothetical protein